MVRELRKVFKKLEIIHLTKMKILKNFKKRKKIF